MWGDTLHSMGSNILNTLWEGVMGIMCALFWAWASVAPIWVLVCVSVCVHVYVWTCGFVGVCVLRMCALCLFVGSLYGGTGRFARGKLVYWSLNRVNEDGESTRGQRGRHVTEDDGWRTKEQSDGGLKASKLCKIYFCNTWDQVLSQKGHSSSQPPLCLSPSLYFNARITSSTCSNNMCL